MTETSGSDEAWKVLAGLDPDGVCRRACAVYDAARRVYVLRSFGQDIAAAPEQGQITASTPAGQTLISTGKEFFRLSLLWYLVGARETSLTGDLIKPADVPGGMIFQQGTHVLPLAAVARACNNREEWFLETAARYGGTREDMGDVAVRLEPFPRVPAWLILWFGDDEFPPAGQLLFDASCSSHLATDVLWAVGMLCCRLLLRDSS